MADETDRQLAGQIYVHRYLLVKLIYAEAKRRKNPSRFLQRFSEQMTAHLSNIEMEDEIQVAAATGELDFIIGAAMVGLTE